MGWNKGDRKYPVVWCTCHRCHKTFELGISQSYRHRKHTKNGTLAGTRFYCNAGCLREHVSDMYRSGYHPVKPGTLSLSRMEAYWKTVEDPNYYQGTRYFNGSPLSFQERGNRIARSVSSVKT